MNKHPEKPRFEMRLPPELAEGIDRWRREQPDLPSRAEAARRLIEIGLASITLNAPPSPEPRVEDAHLGTARIFLRPHPRTGPRA